MLSLWTRPTIPFKLECEAPNKKQEILSEIQKTIDGANGDKLVARAAIATGFWILLLVCISNCLLFGCLGVTNTCGLD